MRLGNVEARITIDDEPLTFSGTHEQLTGFIGRADSGCSRSAHTRAVRWYARSN